MANVAIRSILSHATRVTHAKNSLAFYTTIAGLTRQTWKTTGRAPKPLVQIEEEELESETPKRPLLGRNPPTEPTPRQYAAHRNTMKASFPQGWSPPRKLSREAMDGLRSLHAHDPETFTTPILAEKFRISPEAVRRILKSKWEPSSEQRAKFLQKERKLKEEWILQRRAEEREKVKEIERSQSPERRRSTRGAGRGDRLSLT